MTGWLIYDRKMIFDALGRYYASCEVPYKEAYKRFKAIPGTELSQATCLANLGILYSQVQEFGKAREASETALKICAQYPLGTEQIRKVCLETLRQLK